MPLRRIWLAMLLFACAACTPLPANMPATPTVVSTPAPFATVGSAAMPVIAPTITGAPTAQPKTASTASSMTAITASPRVFSVDPQALAEVKQKIAAGDTGIGPAFAKLLSEANTAFALKPVSVIEKQIAPPSGDKHDYMSMAPYWWPDPTKPNGLPYIRKDGQTNPEIHAVPDKDNLNRMASTVSTLALAYYLKGEERFAAQAMEWLRVWFLNPDTRMNPNLRYGQSVRGVNDGRAEGVLETRALTSVVDAAGLLAEYGGWTPADRQGLLEWFRDYTDWMMTSTVGKEERAAVNNHGTWYDVQMVSFLLFSGRTDDAKSILEQSKTRRIETQIEPNGKLSQEVSRADGWHYTVFDLQAFFALATLGDRAGVDLWSYRTSDGRGIRQALDYLVRFVAGEKWPHTESQDKGWADIYDLLQQAAVKYGNDQYRLLGTRIPAGETASRRSNLLLPAFVPKVLAGAVPTPVEPPRAVQPPDLVICNFEEDIAIWQGYAQNTETILKAGETPPSGFIPDSKLYTAPANRWFKPTAGFVSSAEQVKEGARAGKWDNTVENNRIVAGNIPHDWSQYKYLSFWAYSAVASKTSVMLVVYSASGAAPDDDYYRYKIVLDWTGWKLFEIPLGGFTVTRNPAGWNKVDFLKLASSGWSQTPFQNTLLYFDAMRLTNTRAGQ